MMSDQPPEEFLLQYWKIHEPLIGTLLESMDKIRNNFDDDGNIRGNGQWRLREIFRAVKDADAALQECLEKSDDLSYKV